MLYIANTTKQLQVFCFRAPETARASYVEIPSGQQVAIGQDWTRNQMDAVIQHLKLYGGRESSDVNQRLEHFTGLLYREGKAISENDIVTGHDAVVDMQEHRSAIEATRSAIAFDKANQKNRKRLAKVTEVTVEQDVPINAKPKGDEIRFSVEVSPEGKDKVAL
ncbi:MAG: hypothetical protein KGI54_18410 [Pseudomonadota bacterium]|nr:hypothetical protein [Pseudomonadota bacterium]